MTIVVVLLVFLLAGLVQGGSGFGLALTALPLLTLIMPIKEASPVLALTALTVNAFIFLRLRSHFRWERMLPLALASVAAVPVGVWLLATADARVLQIILGVLMLVAVVHGVVPGLRERRWHPLWLGIPLGGLAGTLTGTLGTGGPPIVAYVSTQGFDRFRYSASIQLTLGLCGLLRLPCLAAGGLLTWRLLGYSAVGCLAAMLGAWMGLRVLKRIPEKVLRYVVSAMLLGLAIKNLIGS